MKDHSPGERLFNALLRLHPREFYERYGRAMRSFYRERRRDIDESGGSRAAFWASVLTDIATAALVERVRALRVEIRSRTHPGAPDMSPRNPPRDNEDHAMRFLLQDLSYAVRSLSRRPIFAFVVVVTIALGVGTNAAIFSVVNGVLIRPLPYPHPERLVAFGDEPPRLLTSEPNFLDYQRGVASLEELAAYTQGLATVSTDDGEPDRVRTARVTGEFFHTIGVSSAIGRSFLPDDFLAGAATSVVLSYGIWQRRFGGDRSVLGRAVVVNGVRRTVIGVMPAHFNFPEAATDIWVPIPRFNPDNSGNRSNHYLFMVGRLRSGATIDRMRNEAKLVAARIMADNPPFLDPKQPLRPHIDAVHDQLVRNSRPYLLALLGTVGFVLLIACANVANLMLARAESRRREMAVRSALGASGRRMITQLFTEGALLAFAGGLIGLGLAWATSRMLIAAAPGTIPRRDEITIDWRVLAFTFTASVLAGILISLAPAVRTARNNSFEALKAGGKTLAHGPARGARRALVVIEVALAVVALAGASMLLRSLWNLESVQTGFVAKDVLTARVSIAPRDYDDAHAAVFFQQLVDRVGAIPGVSTAAAAGWLPIVDAGGVWGLIPDGRAYGPGSGSSADQPSAVAQQVTPGYFKATGILLLAGREFSAADRSGAPLVAVVSDGMAKAVWPGEDPIGRRFRVGGGNALPLVTIVGVAGDIRARSFTDLPEPTMYFPHAQTGSSTFFLPRAMSLVVRTTGNPMSVAGAVKASVHTLDPTAPVSEVRTMEDVVDTSVAARRFSTSLLAAFALLALLLAGIGTYGVIAYGVAQRTYEIGVRMALGAERRSVVRLVMVEGVRMCVIGLGIGLAGSVAIGHTLRSLLVSVPPVDVPSIVVTSLLLLVVAVLASGLPARRALSVSPTEALRG